MATEYEGVDIEALTRILADELLAPTLEAAEDALRSVLGRLQADGRLITGEVETNDSLRYQLGEALVALRDLVQLKDGPRDEDYARRKPLAWQAARDLLASNGIDPSLRTPSLEQLLAGTEFEGRLPVSDIGNDPDNQESSNA